MNLEDVANLTTKLSHMGLGQEINLRFKEPFSEVEIAYINTIMSQHNMTFSITLNSPVAGGKGFTYTFKPILSTKDNFEGLYRLLKKIKVAQSITVPLDRALTESDKDKIMLESTHRFKHSFTIWGDEKTLVYRFSYQF